jgi:hypothetical protein
MKISYFSVVLLLILNLLAFGILHPNVLLWALGANVYICGYDGEVVIWK